MRRNFGLYQVLLVLGFVAVGWGQDDDSLYREYSGRYPDQILVGFSVEMTEGNDLNAVIRGDTGAVYRKRDSMVVRGLTVQIYDSTGRQSSILHADSGLVRERRRLFVAHGHVQIVTRDSLEITSDSLFWYGQLTQAGGGSEMASGESLPDERCMVAKRSVHLVTADGRHLWTDTLFWDDARRMVATDASVTIARQDQDTLWGRGLRSDERLQRIVIDSVWGTVRER